MNIHKLPGRLHVDNLAPNEQVILFLRRHIIVFWRKATLFLILAFLPPIVWAVLYSQTSVMDEPQSALRIMVVLGTSLFYLYWLRYLFTLWLDYYLDVWIVTTQRIVNIEQDGLFHRKVSEQHLDRVQDVTVETRGFMQTLLKFGDIHVQTAAEEEHFIFRDIQNATDVAQEIMELQAAAIKHITRGAFGKRKMPSSPTTPTQ